MRAACIYYLSVFILLFIATTPVAAQSVMWSYPGLGEIRRIGAPGSRQLSVFKERPWLSAIAVDIPHNAVFWAEIDNGVGLIRAGSLDGSGQIYTIAQSSGEVYGLALNTATRQIFFTEFFGRSVKRVNYDGSGGQILLSGLDGPMGIAVDGGRNQIFVALNNSGQILRATTTGLSPLVIATEERPGGITADAASGRIYWTSMTLGSVTTSDANGGDKREVISGGLMGPLGVAFHAESQRLFVAEYNADKIYEVPASGVTDLTTAKVWVSRRRNIGSIALAPNIPIDRSSEGTRLIFPPGQGTPLPITDFPNPTPSPTPALNDATPTPSETPPADGDAQPTPTPEALEVASPTPTPTEVPAELTPTPEASPASGISTPEPSPTAVASPSATPEPASSEESSRDATQEPGELGASDESPLPVPSPTAAPAPVGTPSGNGSGANPSENPPVAPDTIQGTLIGSDGGPVPGVEVHLYRIRNSQSGMQRELVQSTKTDGSGVYVFRNVLDGIYQLEPQMPPGAVARPSSTIVAPGQIVPPVMVRDVNASGGIPQCQEVSHVSEVSAAYSAVETVASFLQRRVASGLKRLSRRSRDKAKKNFLNRLATNVRKQKTILRELSTQLPAVSLQCATATCNTRDLKPLVTRYRRAASSLLKTGRSIVDPQKNRGLIATRSRDQRQLKKLGRLLTVAIGKLPTNEPRCDSTT